MILKSLPAKPLLYALLIIQASLEAVCVNAEGHVERAVEHGKTGTKQVEKLVMKKIELEIFGHYDRKTLGLHRYVVVES